MIRMQGLTMIGHTFGDAPRFRITVHVQEMGVILMRLGHGV